MTRDEQSRNLPETDMFITRCLEGDQLGYTDLYERYADGVYRLCYSLVLNRLDAEDVTQETFVYAFKSLQRYDSGRASFKTWLYTIAISRCRNVYRRKRPMTVDLGHIFELRLVAPREETPEAALAHRSASESLAAALASLSPPMREAVVLRYGHGLAFREIAEIMECPPKTAESRVRLAHRHLRGLLQNSGQGLLEELLSF
jgi:RNA polymerase sigma-70 factor, ECF subfamily